MCNACIRDVNGNVCTACGAHEHVGNARRANDGWIWLVRMSLWSNGGTTWLNRVALSSERLLDVVRADVDSSDRSLDLAWRGCQFE